MEEFTFYKYQGSGNDFVILDNRENFFPKQDTALIAKICHRRFGVGADGLILLEKSAEVDFTMVYYNSDGNLSSMCGNGGRCITHFAKFLGIISEKTEFDAVDGKHHATIKNNTVKLKMNDVSEIIALDNYSFLNTGSPHHVQLVKSIEDFNVFSEGRKIRNDIYGVEGSNVNFVEKISEDTFSVRTYERGVEDETLSCGTGVTAVALAMFEKGETKSSSVSLSTPGGLLKVHFEKNNTQYINIYLEGPAEQVFKGRWQCKH